MSGKNRTLWPFSLLLLIMLILTMPEFAVAKSAVAVLGLENCTGTRISKLEELTQTLLSTYLLESGFFKVVEREHLEQVIEEQKYSLTGLFDLTASSIELGKLLVADYILTGSLLL